jgi:hypothetical protein
VGAFCQPLKRNESDFDAVILDEEKAPREPGYKRSTFSHSSISSAIGSHSRKR